MFCFCYQGKPCLWFHFEGQYMWTDVKQPITVLLNISSTASNGEGQRQWPQLFNTEEKEKCNSAT